MYDDSIIRVERRQVQSTVSVALLVVLASIATTAIVFGAGVVVSEWSNIASLPTRTKMTMLGAGLLAVFLDAALIRMVLRRRESNVQSDAPIEIHSDRIDVPPSVGVPAYSLRFADVFLFHRTNVALYVDTHDALHRIYARTLANPSEIGVLERALVSGITQLPDGRERLRAIEQRSELSEKAWARPARVTSALVAILTAIFIVQSLMGTPLESPMVTVGMGANAPALVAAGQTFRLISANFLHAHWVHLMFNVVALFSLGAVVERLLGPARFALLYLVSAVVGAAASTWISRNALFSVGASTAVFGLVGGLLFIALRYRRTMPTEFRQPWRWWMFIGILNGVVSLFEMVDVWAHLGGLVGGFAVAAGLCRAPTPMSLLDTPTSRVQVAFAASLILAMAGFAGHGVWSRYPERAADTAEVLRAFSLDERSEPEQLNNEAWLMLTAGRWGAIDLQVPLQLAERAVARAPDNDHYKDTLATACFHAGQFERAISIEREIEMKMLLSLRDSQVARFALARADEEGGPWVIGEIEGALPELRRDREADRLVLVTSSTAAIEVHGVVADGPRILTVIQVGLEAGHPLEVAIDCKVPSCERWLASSEPVVTLVDASTVTAHRVVRDYDPEVAGLPPYVSGATMTTGR